MCLYVINDHQKLSLGQYWQEKTFIYFCAINYSVDVLTKDLSNNEKYAWLNSKKCLIVLKILRLGVALRRNMMYNPTAPFC